MDFRIHHTLSYPSGDKLSVLGTEIQDKDLFLVNSSIHSLFYRQVPRKPRLVRGDESAQFINNQI